MERGIGNGSNAACKKLESSIDKLEAAKNNIDSALLILACSRWSGKTRLAFEDFLLLSQELSEKLLKASEHNKDCIKKMFNDANNYISSNKILSNLEK